MATITEDYVSFETAKLLKEKGFNGECVAYYSIYKDNNASLYRWRNRQNYVNVKNDGYTIVPTLQMAMKWLREVHYIHIEAFCPVVDVDSDWFGVTYNVVISNLRNHCLAFNTDIEDNEYDTYEQAVEAAIKYCLEHLI